MSVWRCLRSAVICNWCLFGFSSAWGCGLYTLLSHQHFNWFHHLGLYDTHKAQVCRMLVLMNVRSNGSVSKCSIPFTCAKHLQETAKRERGDGTINMEFRPDTDINEYKLECVKSFLPHVQKKNKNKNSLQAQMSQGPKTDLNLYYSCTCDFYLFHPNILHSMCLQAFITTLLYIFYFYLCIVCTITFL